MADIIDKRWLMILATDIFFADRTTVKMLGINSSGSGSSTQIVQQDRPLEPDPQDCGIMGCLVLYIYI